MSVRELVVLGTASQVPTRHRNHTGYLLRWDGEGFLFDPGEGTQRQMLRAGVAAHDLNRICVTHFHGDHCLGLGSISAVARHCAETDKKLRVLWLDAHADFNTSALTPSGNVHGMPVACLCGLGPPELTGLAGMPGGGPALRPQQVRQIGIRSVDAGEKRLVHEQGLEVFDMRAIDEIGMRQAMQQALAGMDDKTHLHVSFDVDFLDPAIAPGVGTTVPGGPTYREAQLCMEMIADSGRLASLDIMELNPALDVRNQTAEVAVDLVESLFGKSTLMRVPPLK